MSIPVLIVPILNGPELLERLLRSIDYPVDKIVIVDNGDVVHSSETPSAFGPEISERRQIITAGHNLGVAASWNLGIKATALADWWLISNHDIEFGAGDLERLASVVEPRAAAVYHMLGMAAFAVTPPAMRAVGFFDENIHPAYDEDIDWERRADLAGIVKREAGFTGTHVGSATIYADPVLRHLNGASHAANHDYYAQKWGGPQGAERFNTPFDRHGNVGEWVLDITRLREQSWEKR